MLTDQAGGEDLQLRARQADLARTQVGERGAHRGVPAAGAPARPREHRLQRRHVEQPVAVGLVQRLREVIGGQDRREVDQRPLDRRHRQPVDARHLGLRERGAVETDAIRSDALTGDGDVGVAVVRGAEPVQPRGVTMTQHRPAASGEQRRDADASADQAAVPDGVDAAMEFDEMATSKAVSHHRRREA